MTAAFHLLAPLAALAHASGASLGEARVARFALPPWVVWVAGASVVALSFLLVAAFLTRPHAQARPPAALDAAAPDAAAPDAAAPDASQTGNAQAVPIQRDPRPRRILQSAALALVLLACLPAVMAERAAASQLPFVVVWLLGWTVLPVAAYALGEGAWRALHPWAALARIADAVRAKAGRRAAQPPLALLTRVGAWPGVLVLLAVIGLEVWSGSRLGAAGLSRVLLAYALLTFAAMLVFGGSNWFARGDFHARMLDALSRAAPLSRGRPRPPWVGLRTLRAHGPGEVAFLVALLYGVNFDGFVSTRWGRLALDRLDDSLGALGAHALLLVAGYVLFLTAFAWTARAIRQRSEALEPSRDLAARFAASLVPIALVYHAAHNLPYLVESLPAVARAALDPLGLGWAGAALAPLPSLLVLPQLAYDVVSVAQLLLIVGGHVLAVVVAHDLALLHFPSAVQAFRSEIPLTQVMVFYSLVGLWIVATATHGVGH